jgi:hypothetical protein
MRGTVQREEEKEIERGGDTVRNDSSSRAKEKSVGEE